MKTPWLAIIVITCVILGLIFAFIIYGKKDVKIYLFKDGNLSAVSRPLNKEIKKSPKFALESLLRGPTEMEKMEGYSTQLPDGAQLRDLTIIDGIGEASFSRQLEQYGGGASKVQAVIAQIVYTLTEFKNIKKVQVLIEGEKQMALGGEGFIIDSPMGRQDVRF